MEEYNYELENRKQKIKGITILAGILLGMSLFFCGMAKGTSYLTDSVYKIMGVEK
jgi:Na+/H+ antiporter NhaA